MKLGFQEDQHSTTPMVSWQPGREAGSRDKTLILIVDDNPDVTFLFASILEHAGYTTHQAFSAPEALEAAKQKHFNVVVSDIGMPGMDGYQFARSLRALPEYQSTPIVAVTGFAEFAAHEKAFSAGFNAHLKKPVEPTKLLEILARLQN